MTQFPRLSDREWEVIRLLLQGKSNKLIASSLSVSVRTVEFHLRNIYAKFQVGSRLELILELGKATGGFDAEKLGQSTVAGSGGVADNRERLNSRTGWAASSRDAVSILGEEFDMKRLLSSKHVLVGMSAALLAGILWVCILLSTQYLSLGETQHWTWPLIVIWATIGLSIGGVGMRNGDTLLRVFSSALFGAGLSPFTFAPLMLVVVLPVGRLAEWLGLIDPSTMSSQVAADLAAITMMILWLVVGLTVGIACLFVAIKKPEKTHLQAQVSE